MLTVKKQSNPGKFGRHVTKLFDDRSATCKSTCMRMPPPSRNLRMLLNRDESRLNGPSSALPHRIEQKTPAGLVSQPSRYIPPWHHHDVNVNSPFRVRSSPEIFNPSRPAVFPAALVFRAFARQSLSPTRQAGWRKTRRVRLPDLVTGIRVAMRQATTGGDTEP